MKQASTALINLINGGEFVFWDCYTLTLKTGVVIAITNANFNIFDGTRTFSEIVISIRLPFTQIDRANPRSTNDIMSRSNTKKTDQF